MKGFTVRADHIIIDGFEITDTDNDSSEGWGIFVEGSHCVLKSNYVYFATRGGIILFANGGDGAVTSDCVVKDNRLRRNSQVGIEVQGKNNLIEDNEIWGTIQYHPKWTNPPSWVDADGIRFFGFGHTIRKNYIHDITFDDPENVDPHIDCFQTWRNFAGHDILFEQNYCENLNEGMYAFMLADAKNLTIRNNILQAAGGVNTGGGVNGPSSNLTIVNNVFANDLSFQAYPGGVGLANSPNTVVKNNIFYNQRSHSISVTGSTSGLEIDHNLAYRSDGKPSRCYVINWECVDPAPIRHLWDVNPLFVDPAAGDFHLRQDSPAIDAGISLSEVSNDFNGAAPDLGAFESPFFSPLTFADVPIDHWAYPFIEATTEAGLTVGYPDGTYRPDNLVTRAEMSVFLKKGIHGSDYAPPSPDGSHPFSDIAGHWAEAWIEDLYDEGMTSGFPDGTHRPENRVTRAEIAVFLLKAILGSGYTPQAIDGSHPFTDITGHWAEAWIEDLHNEGITSGYADGAYRADNPVTRAEIAVFLVNTFSLPVP
jgi:parallel beta-helix repeat protein